MSKCKVCTKTVYPMDPLINLDGSVFHKPCAKCADCQCQITISNFTKNESGDQTLLLCKTHYFKRFHEGGSYVGGEKFQNKTKSETTSPLATIKTSSKCKICTKSVYPMDPQINLDGNLFHNACAKCADCQCQITLANFTKNQSADQTLLLCNTHYFKRFHEGGSLVGAEKYQAKTTRDVLAANKTAESQSSVQNDIAEAAEIKPVDTTAAEVISEEISAPIETKPEDVPPPVPTSEPPVESNTAELDIVEEKPEEENQPEETEEV